MAVQVPAAPASGLNEEMVLLKAVRRAGEELGLSDEETTQALNKSSTFFEQAHPQNPMDPSMGQMIASVLRLHRSLSALVGNDITLMRHWMATVNRHTGGVPRQQLQDPGQLVKMVQYLEAMRGRP